MKTLLILLACLTLSPPAWSRSDSTEMSLTNSFIASFANRQLEETGAWPPLENLTRFEEIALRDKSPKRLLYFNKFAAVPGMPLLKPDGDKIRYTGLRLYSVNRIPNFEKTYSPEVKKTGGRYVILFTQEPGKTVHYVNRWIPEPEVQAMLQQAGNFDPRTAPFAFQDTYLKLGGDLELLLLNNFPQKRPSRPPWTLIFCGLALFTLIISTWPLKLLPGTRRNRELPPPSRDTTYPEQGGNR